MTLRLVVMGDNHGNVEALRRVRDDMKADRIDLAIHVGDFTTAWRTSRQYDDRNHGTERGVEQLRSVEPVLNDIAAATEHGLLWVWGNQDYFGELDYDLRAGTEIPDDDCIEVAGQRFTNAPNRVESDVVLVTHMEKWSLIDHFEGRAHFCGNTHRGRRTDRRLNSAFLHIRDPETGDETYGGYFVVELDDDEPLEVELRNLGALEQVECETHAERGVQFQPRFRGCMYCTDEYVLMREMAASAFYGLTHDAPREAVSRDELVAYAVSLWDDPPENFRDTFETYLTDLPDDRYAPLALDTDGRITLAENDYAY